VKLFRYERAVAIAGAVALLARSPQPVPGQGREAAAGRGPCAGLPGHDWPLVLCTGGYERGARGMTIQGYSR
jgi:hypothetical protein